MLMPGRSPLTVPSRLRGVFGFDSFEAEDAPGDPEGWSRAFQELIEEMEEQFPERWGTGDLDQWLRDPQVRAGIRPLVADRAVTAQFLASKGIVLTAEARELFLDCVTSTPSRCSSDAPKGTTLPMTYPASFPSSPASGRRKLRGSAHGRCSNSGLGPQHYPSCSGGAVAAVLGTQDCLCGENPPSCLRRVSALAQLRSSDLQWYAALSFLRGRQPLRVRLKINAS
jgi:hypothetical protein